MQSTEDRLTDEELMGRLCAAADRETADRIFGQVFERYHGRVVSWCYRIAKNREASRDLAQEVFIKAYRHRDAFRGEARLSTWLYAIARNHCLTAIRKPDADALRFDSAALLSLREDGMAPDRAAEQNELTARMLRLMARILEPIEVRVMTLHYAHEVPLAAITRDLDLRNPSGAKAHIVNARRKLMGLLKRGGWNNCAIGPGFRAVPMRRVG
jgi:RNA polymerase sigma-70 factor (ECF subfamily)